MPRKSAKEIALERRQQAYQVAATRFLIALKALRDRVRYEQRYNPDWASEPRVPAGNPGPGQWTVGGGQGSASTQSETLVADNSRDPSFYSVDLQDEERIGGHAIREHVGRSQASLKEQVEKTYRVLGRLNGITVVKLQGAEGSFLSLGDANYFVSETLRHNSEQLENILSGASPQETLEWRFGYQTGIEAYWPQLEPPAATRTTYSVTRYCPC